jgi:putative flippase GtrA
MKLHDFIFSAITGFCVAFVFAGFVEASQFHYLAWHLFWLFPIMSIAGLWICEILGRKFHFIHQAGKFFLVGAFSAIVDIKVYQIFAWALAFLLAGSIISKCISFLVATAVKYGGNKIWVFQKKGRDGIKKEVIQFSFITLIGMIIDVFVFYCATTWLQPQNIPTHVWTEISIIIAALVAAIWNFLGYKFIVFKK